MKRKTSLAFFLAFCAIFSSCSKIPDERPAVTFRRVKTEGITAQAETMRQEKASETAETAESSDQPETAETSVSKITHHYNTTIPETLIGQLPTVQETAETAQVTETKQPPETRKPAPKETTEITTRPPETLANGAYSSIGDNGILVIKRGDGHYWGLMPCWGTYSLCEDWAGGVNAFARRLPNVSVYQTIIPTASEFYVPEGFDGFTGSQLGKISHVSERLENVTNIDSYSALAARLGEPVFSRTDHHWMPLGGYYAAKAFADAAGVPFPELSEYKSVTAGGFVGSLYVYSGDRHIADDPEDFTIYLPPNNSALTTTYYDQYFSNGYESELFIYPDGSGYYCSFLGSDDRIAKIDTDCKNGRTLVIFKESYGNALVPFLTSSFETIYVCDIRYFGLNAAEFCENVGATDLLFAVCTFTAAGTNGKYVSKILEQ